MLTIVDIIGGFPIANVMQLKLTKNGIAVCIICNMYYAKQLEMVLSILSYH